MISSNNTVYVIGISGKKGHGKTYCANLIKDYYNKQQSATSSQDTDESVQPNRSSSNMYLVAFADPLKDAIKSMFLLDNRDVEDPTYKELVGGYSKDILGDTITPRKLMQFLGTEMMRNQFNKIKDTLDNNVSSPHNNCVDIHNVYWKPNTLSDMITKTESNTIWIWNMSHRIYRFILERIQQHQYDADTKTIIIIHDVRFRDEIEFILSLNDKYIYHGEDNSSALAPSVKIKSNIIHIVNKQQSDHDEMTIDLHESECIEKHIRDLIGDSSSSGGVNAIHIVENKKFDDNVSGVHDHPVIFQFNKLLSL